MVVFSVVMQGSSLHPNLGSVNMSPGVRGMFQQIWDGLTLTGLKRSAERSLVMYAIKVGLAVLAVCNIKIAKVTCLVEVVMYVHKLGLWARRLFIKVYAKTVGL